MCVLLSAYILLLYHIAPCCLGKSGAFRTEYLCALLEEIWVLKPFTQLLDSGGKHSPLGTLLKKFPEGLIFFDTTS